ncbi:MAG: NPCBM/NEW2 domain-containing protein [Planctomycetota bacterium]|nr:NPCBM/NEW2 domain-containing protein [Planctomycetota bacterium]
MSIVNGAVLDLTTRKPSEVSYRPFFKQTWEYRLNRSLSGGPLKVNGVAYEKGIATHSFTSLTFELGGKYSRFSAICGVDDSAADEGSVDFRVLLDGRVVYESGVLKKGEQSRVDLKLGDAKELVLETGFGGDDDIGDHGDWCVPRLIEDIAQAVRKLPVQSPNGG